MSKNIVLELVRAVLLAVGSWLVASGKLDDAGMQEIVGALLSCVTVIWSVRTRVVEGRAQRSVSGDKPPYKLPVVILLGGLGVLMMAGLNSCVGKWDSKVVLTEPKSGISLVIGPNDPVVVKAPTK